MVNMNFGILSFSGLLWIYCIFFGAVPFSTQGTSGFDGGEEMKWGNRCNIYLMAPRFFHSVPQPYIRFNIWWRARTKTHTYMGEECSFLPLAMNSRMTSLVSYY